MAFENNRSKRFGTMKRELVYLFNYSIIFDPIKTWRKNSSICGSTIGTALLVPSCVKSISVNVVTVKALDPIAKASSNLSQLGTHGRINVSLQFVAGLFINYPLSYL